MGRGQRGEEGKSGLVQKDYTSLMRRGCRDRETRVNFASIRYRPSDPDRQTHSNMNNDIGVNDKLHQIKISPREMQADKQNNESFIFKKLMMFGDSSTNR